MNFTITLKQELVLLLKVHLLVAASSLDDNFDQAARIPALPTP